MLEPCLEEVKHKGKLKLWHTDALACGRILHATIHWKNRQATTPRLPLPDHQPTSCQLQTCLRDLQQTKQNTFLLEPHLAEKKTKKETKLRNSEPPACTKFSMPRYTEKTGGLLHCQTPTPNLLRRCRQTGPDAEGVTPDLLRLKFYCS
jgi:hypothetical protein